MVIGNLGGGGAERVLVHLANFFSKMHIDVTIICIGSATVIGEKEAYKRNINTKVLMIHKPEGKNLVFQKVQQWRLIRTTLFQIKPDVIVSFMNYINIQLLLLTRGLGIPLIICERSDPMATSNKFLRGTCQILYPFADGAVFQNHYEKEFFFKFPKRKDAIIWNPILLDTDTNFSYRKDVKKIICACRLDPQKNLKLLLSAYKRISPKFSEVNLEIWGEGPQRNELEALACELKLQKRVSFPGRTNDILSKLCEGDIFILTSEFEGMPNALLEAMCIGMPCISSAFNGVEEFAQDGENILLFEKGNEDILVSKIEELIYNYDLRCYLGKNALKLRSKVDMDLIGKQWLQFIEEIIG